MNYTCRYLYVIYISGLGRLSQAEEYLSQAQWTVLKTPKCSNAIKSKLYRNLGLLYAAKGEYDEALRSLADDVSSASFITCSCTILLYSPEPLFTEWWDILKSCEVSKSWDLIVYSTICSDIWQVPQIHCCWDACKISDWYDHFNRQSPSCSQVFARPYDKIFYS